MPDQVSYYCATGARIQILCPPQSQNDEPVLYEFEAASIEFEHREEYEKDDLEMERPALGWTVEGTFKVLSRTVDALSAKVVGPRKIPRKMKEFNDEAEYLRRRVGLRVIRFKKKEGKDD